MVSSSAPSLSPAAASVWAKSPRHSPDWLPLWRHLDDSAAVAGELWDRWLPAATRHLIGAALPGGDSDGRLVATWLAGVHDIGKATPAFALQVRELAGQMRDAGLEMPYTIPSTDRRYALHATTGQVLLERWLVEVHGWPRPRTSQFAIVVGGHHGVPPDSGAVADAEARPHWLGLAHDQQPWQLVQRELLDRAAHQWGVGGRLAVWRDVALPQPAQVLLTALVIVADWIASNEDLFPYDPEGIFSPTRLMDAWEELDLPTPWQPVPTEASADELFATRFTLPPAAAPRPVQINAVEVSRAMSIPGLLIVEAPMGEGKTEAALAAAEQLAARCGAGGCFVALPTRATSDAMFARVRSWLERVPDADLDAGAFAVSLAHGKARFNADFDRMLMRRGHTSAVAQDDPPGARGTRDGRTRELAAHQWLQGRKKAMLSSFVVGTIDQLLFGALKSRHLALRHLGLAGKVVVIDEVHAYDVYMSQYLDRALEWLAAYGVPVIVLSATLPGRRRRQLVEAYDRGRGIAPPPRSRPSWRGNDEVALADPYAGLTGDIGYPVLAATGNSGAPLVRHASPSGRSTPVMLGRLDDDLDALTAALRTDLAEGGCALVIRNTVRRVQEAAVHLREALKSDGIDVSLAHSRFMAPDRAEKDRWLRESFGPPDRRDQRGGSRPDRHVVVASQVAEQSLDIDFDLLVTDLAPVDLVLQRAGRLHRHERGKGQADRPPRLRQARCLITGVDWSTSPPQPAAGSVRVYTRHPLLRSLAVLDPYLDGERPLVLPSAIAPLVQDGYGDAPVGPESWQDVMGAERAAHDRRQLQKQRKADGFRLAPVGKPGRAIFGWLDANVGDADDDPRLEGRQQVRDTAAETVDVLVVVRLDDGTVVTPPWLREGGGRQVPVDHEPPVEVARTVASCTLGLPIELSNLEVIEELERANSFEGWQQSRWLEGELVLVLDAAGEAELCGHRLRYHPQDGLMVGRLE